MPYEKLYINSEDPLSKKSVARQLAQNGDFMPEDILEMQKKPGTRIKVGFERRKFTREDLVRIE